MRLNVSERGVEQQALELFPWSPGSITGIVKNRQNEVIPEVTVLLSKDNIAHTDSSGTFTFTDVDPGVYDLRIVDGFDTISGYEVSVYEGAASELVIIPGKFNSQSNTIKIVVVDYDTQEPVPGVKVKTSRSDSETVCNNVGIVDLTIESIGSMKLTISAAGYQTKDTLLLNPESNDCFLLPIKKGQNPESGPLVICEGTVVDSLNNEKNNERLVKDSVVEMGKTTVSATMIHNSTAAMLTERRKSTALSDGISGIEISKAGASNAADAMKKVTGATVTNGKYIYVRGLGERYNITLLDGAEIPSTDPDKRTVPMDIFPSSLIENITAIKTFSPDLPGTFSGGCINIVTKESSGKPTLSVSASGSYNSQTTFRDDFLTYEGGKLDWLGFDDGTRSIPTRLRDTSFHIPSGTMKATEESHANARLIDTVTKLFKPVMAPTKTTAGVNQGYSANFGARYSAFSIPIGVLASLSYSHKDAMYADGKRKLWQMDNTVDANGIEPDQEFDENKSSRNVLWGALSRCQLELPNQLQEFINFSAQIDYMYVRRAEDVVQERSGWGKKSSGQNGNYIVSSTLDYTEQGINSLALKGNLQIAALNNLEADIRYAKIASEQNEPDDRFFIRSYTQSLDSTKVWSILQSIYTVPARYFRDLSEKNNEFSVNLKMPFQISWGDSATAKSGFFESKKVRKFFERRFEYLQGFSFTEDPAAILFSDSVLGIIDSSQNRWKLGNYIKDGSELKGNYHGNQLTTGGYFLGNFQ